MTRQPNQPNSASSAAPRSPRLRQSASVLSMVSLLASSVVQAQTPEPIAEVAPSQTAPLTTEPVTPAPALEVAPAPVEALPPEFTPVDPVPAAPPALPDPSADTSIAPPSNFNNPDSFIDTTDYSLGATERSQPTVSLPADGLPAAGVGAEPQLIAPPTVQFGPLTIGESGSVELGGVTVTPPATAQNYYYRTIRPPARLGNGNLRLIFPLAIPAPITSIFGWRIHPISSDKRFHSGTDLGAPLGTPVLAAYAGQVAIADFLGGYGLAVTLAHNKGSQETLYAHLSEIFVRPGETVKQGEVIGRVGSTGNSTGPHLHFEFRQRTPDGWVVLDPGAQLEYALAQLVKALQVGQSLQPGGQVSANFSEISRTNINLGKVMQFKVPLTAQKPAKAEGRVDRS